MEEKMTQQEIVESYFEDYFGHDLFETLTNDEIAEAIVVVNNLAHSINEYFGLNEQKKKKEKYKKYKVDEPNTTADDSGALGILAPYEDARALNFVSAIVSNQASKFGRTSGPTREL